MCWLVPGLIYVSFWMISFSGCRVKSGVFLVRRMLSPLISIRCALWIMRSRIASAIVGSPMNSCQPDMGKLGGDDCRASLVTFLKEFEQIKPLLISEAMGAPIIENEQLDPGELVDQSGETAIKTGHGHVLKKPWHPDIENGVVEPGSLMSKSAGQPCFAGSRLPGEDDLLMGPDPASLGERQDMGRRVERNGIPS